MEPPGATCAHCKGLHTLTTNFPIIGAAGKIVPWARVLLFTYQREPADQQPCEKFIGCTRHVGMQLLRIGDLLSIFFNTASLILD